MIIQEEYGLDFPVSAKAADFVFINVPQKLFIGQMNSEFTVLPESSQKWKGASFAVCAKWYAPIAPSGLKKSLSKNNLYLITKPHEHIKQLQLMLMRLSFTFYCYT